MYCDHAGYPNCAIMTGIIQKLESSIIFKARIKQYVFLTVTSFIKLIVRIEILHIEAVSEHKNIPIYAFMFEIQLRAVLQHIHANI